MSGPSQKHDLSTTCYRDNTRRHPVSAPTPAAIAIAHKDLAGPPQCQRRHASPAFGGDHRRVLQVTNTRR